VIDFEFADSPPHESRPIPARKTVAPQPIARESPHSVEAEQHLLACCFIDGDASIAKCLNAKLPPAAFFVPANRIIYAKMTEIYHKSPPVAVEIIAEELKKSGGLEDIGGISYLLEVSGRTTTTLQVDYFLGKVRELHSLRELIRVATRTVEQCHNFQGDIGAFLDEIDHDISAVKRATSGDRTWSAKSFIDFEPPPVNDTSILLGKYRYLCRGGSAIIVGPSHVGKSSICFHWATMAALGRPMGGIETHGKLTSLIINGEDDAGDVGECSVSVRQGENLTDNEIEDARSRVHIIDAKLEVGEAFFRELKNAVAKYKPDLVWINPLLAFAGLDITKPGEASKLRAMLNSANPDSTFAYMIVHHTNKPPSSKDKGEKNWNEHMYNMTGSADLTNLARVVICIEATKEKGRFVWRLAKRGPRAGIIKETPADPENGEPVHKTEIVSEIYMKHSSRKVHLADGRTLPMILWELDPDGKAEIVDDTDDSRKRGGRKPTHEFNDFRDVFREKCRGSDNAKGYNVLHRYCQQLKSIGGAAFNRILDDAVTGGLLNRNSNGYYMPGIEPKK